MANLRRVEEYRGTFTASLSTLRDMEDANYQAFTSLYRQYRDSNVVENLLTGIGGAALGIIFALAPVKPPITISSLAVSIVNIVDGLSNSSRLIHMDALLGGQDILRQLIDVMESPNYQLIEAEVVFNHYIFSDNSSVRFVRGNVDGNQEGHQFFVRRIKTSNGWIVL